MGLRPRLAIDAGALAAYLVVSNTVLTGIPVHEWLSLGLAVLFAVHVAVNWDWAVRVISTFFQRLGNISRLNLVLDLALLVAVSAVMLTGIMVSESVLPLLHIRVPFGPTWRIMHSVSAKLLLLVVGLHTGLHWRWIVKAAQRPSARGDPQRHATASAAQEG